jgi:hypothetical protein
MNEPTAWLHKDVRFKILNSVRAHTFLSSDFGPPVVLLG